jgi:hypothetical protein
MNGQVRGGASLPGGITRRLSVAALWLFGALMLAAPPAIAADAIKNGGPYVPTPSKVVEAMLDLAAVRAGDFVMDLGSGDGRIVLTAAERYRARGTGVDIDQELVDRANAFARDQGVADRVRFLRQDVQAADLRQATVVTLYLLPGMMAVLRPKLLNELRPGTRIVSHDFDFGDWKPDRSVEIETPEKYDLAGTWTSMVHLWIVPVRVQGAWQGMLAAADGTRFRLEIEQTFQRIEGRLTRDGREAPLREGRVEGRQIRFTVPRAGEDGVEHFLATVDGERMTGEMAGEGGTRETWSARRVP